MASGQEGISDEKQVVTPKMAGKKYTADWESLNQREMPEWFGQAKFGIFIHWGIYSVPAYTPVMEKDSYSEWYRATMRHPSRAGHVKTKAFHDRVYGEDFKYADFAPMFHAALFDAKHWAEMFKASGAKYVVPTTKHHDGFCMWPSKEASLSHGRPWNSSEIGPRRDLLGETAAAVREAGMKFGVYYSLMEWDNPYRKISQANYVDKVMLPQIHDIVNTYKPSLIFTDGEWEGSTESWKSLDVLAWLFNDSPVKDNVVVADRWGEKERGKHACTYYTSEYGAGLDGSHVWEENRGIGESYGYNQAENAKDYLTASELIVVLSDVVSRGGNLLLNVGPTASGQIPAIQEDRLLSMGKWLEVNGEAIYGTTMWKQARQWSNGKKVPIKTGIYQNQYSINDAVKIKKDDTPYLDAFFTAKENCFFAIVPQLTGKQFIVHDLHGNTVKSVHMLGREKPLAWSLDGGKLIIKTDGAFMHSEISSYPHCFRITFK